MSWVACIRYLLVWLRDLCWFCWWFVGCVAVLLFLCYCVVVAGVAFGFVLVLDLLDFVVLVCGGCDVVSVTLWFGWFGFGW